jgi:hypothetical protein
MKSLRLFGAQVESAHFTIWIVRCSSCFFTPKKVQTPDLTMSEAEATVPETKKEEKTAEEIKGTKRAAEVSEQQSRRNSSKGIGTAFRRERFQASTNGTGRQKLSRRPRKTGQSEAERDGASGGRVVAIRSGEANFLFAKK